jgi:hypothetical protein
MRTMRTGRLGCGSGTGRVVGFVSGGAIRCHPSVGGVAVWRCGGVTIWQPDSRRPRGPRGGGSEARARRHTHDPPE